MSSLPHPFTGNKQPLDPCWVCEHPCDDHPSVPATLLSKVDMTSILSDSVKTYHRHLLVCTGDAQSRWPEKVETEGFIQLLATRLDALSATSNIKHSVLACDRPTADHAMEEECFDVILMPQMICFHHLTEALLTEFIEIVLNRGLPPPPTIQFTSLKAHEGIERCILICTHMKRDKRCGVLGPLIYESLNEILDQKQLVDTVALFQVSHFGGHKFAGNVILYPEGCWYGRVTPCNVRAIVEQHLISGQVVQELYRGKIENADPLSW